MHDCLKILKYLASAQPNEPIIFSEDNLLMKDGHVKLSDAFLNKTHIQQELSKLRKTKVEQQKTSKKQPWQLQNIQFIAELACKLLASAEFDDEAQKV